MLQATTKAVTTHEPMASVRQSTRGMVTATGRRPRAIQSSFGPREHSRAVKRAAFGGLLAGALLFAAPAHAYRPFDSTDADVTGYGELELEVGPVGYLRTRTNGQFAPNQVINVGVLHRVELVLQGRELLTSEAAPAASSRLALTDTAFFMKVVLREGILQGSRGPSVALEIGPWLPTFNDQTNGVGGSADLITSYRWSFTTIHLNVQAARTRSANPDLFVGAIIEGPIIWPIRPVSELVVDREFSAHTTYSALIGFIAPLQDDFDLDFGTRIALTDGLPIYEARAGFSWAIPLWQ